jgi:aldose sugar dehydrogenase
VTVSRAALLALALAVLMVGCGSGGDDGGGDSSAATPTPSPTATPAATAQARRARGMRVRTLVTGLEVPWEIAFLPDRRALVTERPGRVRLLERDGKLRRSPVATVPVSAQGEGGLLGLALDPDYASNRFV